LIYSVSHTTTFRYDPAVREAVMEVRLHPRSESDQRCLSFMLEIDPVASVLQYRDFAGNEVHHFDIAATHAQLKITAKSQVEVQTVPPPRESDAGDWADLDALVASGDYWEMLLPSHLCAPLLRWKVFPRNCWRALQDLPRSAIPVRFCC